ncbi:MAG: SMC-Scp complex subunit ScpB, partial [Gemmatimonadota bacterium]
MTPEQIVEATLFSSQTALTAAELARADRSLDIGGVEAAIQTLRDRYEAAEHAFQIYQLGEGYQILTRPEFAPYLEQFDSVPRAPTLSPAALETLAIIVYRQPIGRVEIEDVRGVSASSVLRTLLEWDLIQVTGRGEGLGRPLLYGVSRVFLDHFGLTDLGELPDPESLPVRLKELSEAAAERLERMAPAKSEPAAEPEPMAEFEVAAESDVVAESEPVAQPLSSDVRQLQRDLSEGAMAEPTT